jgi:phosphopantothenoylcysteine decarboxylase/phosphopantothenate--cysteine ligase
VSILEGARVVLCVSGSIAAYKGADLASKLTQAGSQVDTLLTKAATSFVSPLTFEALTARAVYSEAASMTADHSIAHVRLGQDADVIVFAPATAAAIARLAQGLTDDLATATALASSAPLVIAPAMEPQMLSNDATQANLRTLQERGAHVVPPAEGRLASGHIGRGRLPGPEVLLDAIRLTMGREGVLKDRTLVVSGGKY